MNLMQPVGRQRTLPFIFLTGLLFLMMPVLSFMLSSLVFILGISIGPVHLPVLLVLTLLFVYGIGTRYFGRSVIKPFAWSVLVFIGISVVGAWHLNRIWDTSFDGVWYHQEAVINFCKGWNPYYRMLAPEEGSIQGPFYDNHYPKSAWIAESVVYAFTGKLESSKVVNLWMMLGLLFTSLFALLHIKALPAWIAVLLSILVGANPVSIYQLYAFYIDGQLGAGIMAMIILLAASVMLGSRLLFGLALLVFVYVANIKFTGLVYASCLMVFYLGYLVWKKREGFARQFIGVAVAGLAAVLVWGYPTYVTNTISNKHPLYPIMGPGSKGEEIAMVPQSANFAGKNRVHKFWLATFADPVWCRAPLESTPKKLFRPVRDPSYFARADFEISGFGPYYAELFVFILLATMLIVFAKIPYKAEWLFVMAALVLTSFINSEAWYARYVPHLWLFGLVGAVALFHHKQLRYFGVLLVLGLLFNNFTLARYYIRTHLAESREAHKQMEALKKLDRPVHIFIAWQVTFPVKAKEYGLSYIAPPPAGFDKKEYADFAGFNSGWGMYNIAELEEAKKLAGGEKAD